MPLPGQTLGDVETITTDPAAGSEIIFTADGDMIVHAAVFQFTTDATVANRTVQLKADDGTHVFFSVAAGTQAASISQGYAVFSGSAFQSASTILLAFPSGGLRLRKNDRLRTATSSIQAGDNYGAMTLRVERL